jgi:hypothetical protein
MEGLFFNVNNGYEPSKTVRVMTLMIKATLRASSEVIATVY